ncbi:unnamed protein product [Orchesella dallaii]|uniref:Odorant receptor n=1 Tax=Orchesella dallaii TaxID=48710 RepID=A0ABP1RJV9_9HEXA
MGLKEAALRVLAIAQKNPAPLPLFIISDPRNVHHTLVPNARFFNSKSQRIAWKFGKFGLIFLAASVICLRIIPLAATISLAEGTNLINTLEELGVHSFLIALCFLIISSYFTIEKNLVELCFILNEALKLLDFTSRKGFSTNSTKGAIETFIYGVGVIFCVAPGFIFLLPFLRAYDPIQWTLLRYFNFGANCYPLKICAGIIYTVLVAPACPVLLVVILLCGTCLDCCQRVSSTLLSVLATGNSKLATKSRSFLFTRKLKLYQKLRIFLTIFNSVFKEFGTVGVGTCIQISIWCSTILITMRGILPLALCINCGLFLVCAGGILFFFIRLAGSSHTNGSKFRRTWRWYCMKKYERVKLRSCPQIGFALYPAVKHISQYTALLISNLILNYTATFVILKSA